MQANTGNSLPNPDAASSAHSSRCAKYIQERIRAAGGSISFGEYMHHALYAPGLGYYAAGATKFGEHGDFITAPEVSPLFGRIVARQCAEVLTQTGTSTVLEIGAGSGRLAVDVLTKLAAIEALPSEYLILEVSADLQDRQRALINEELPEIASRVRWLKDLPASCRGVILVNEVLDAMPVERFVRRDDILEQHVRVKDGDFALIEKAASVGVREAVVTMEKDIGRRLPHGYVSEISLAVPPWIEQLCRGLEHGCVFLFDYGLDRASYYAPDRSDGWLRCHFRHHAHGDALRLPGIQDITTWVDFTAAATAADATHAEVAGFTDQAHFLIDGGLHEELLSMASSASDAQVELSAQAKMLTLPGHMGEHFKCMALSRGLSVPPTAFQNHDRTHTL